MATCTATFRNKTHVRPNGTTWTTSDYGHAPCGKAATHTKTAPADMRGNRVTDFRCSEHTDASYAPVF